MTGTTFMAIAAVLAASPIKLAAPGFRAVQADEKKVSFFSDYFAEQLTQSGHISVVTSNEIATLLGLERQKALLGCSDDVTCNAEVAGALGVDGVITGSVARLGNRYTFTIKVTSTKDARALASATNPSLAETEVVEWLTDTAKQLVPKIRRAALPPSDAVAVEAGAEGGGALRAKAWIPAAAGGALAITGGVLFLVSDAKYRALTGRGSTAEGPEAVRAAAGEGKTLDALAVTAGGVGTALLLAAGAMALFGGGEEPTASVVAGPGGAGLVVGGRF